jgi:predicted Ser/Thr protein kinase
MRNHSHPAPDQLAAFASGQASEDSAAQISLHLAECDSCRTLVDNLPPDTLVSLLRQSSGPGDLTDNHAQVSEALTAAGMVDSQAGGVGVPKELAAHPRYHVLGLLGSGGMGAVYKAEHRRMERAVALKVINASLTNRPDMVQRFEREAKAAAKLTHPNIVTAYDSDQAGDIHFLVMEYIEGISLAQKMQEEGPLPVHEACAYIQQAALGLQHAFEQGMVHRDIKPHNLMLTPRGQVKILDFGLARFARETAVGSQQFADSREPKAESREAKSGLTQVGVLMGTADFIAPEQASDPHKADIRADIYSLGCTLYFLLAGHSPFPEGTAVDKLIAHAERAPKPLNKLRSDVPVELVRVLDKMMAKNPKDRYQTPAAVAEALVPFLGDRDRRRSWRRPVVAGLAAVATCLALLAAAIIFFWQSPDGIVRFEINDPDIQVVIDKDGPKITGLDKTPITLKPGKHGLSITRGDFTFDTTTFELKRRGETKLKIDWFADQKLVVSQDGREIAVRKRPGPGITEAEKAAKIEAATKAAREYLKLVDAGEFGRAWEEASSLVHKAITKNEFIKTYEQLPGKVTRRRLESRVYMTDIPGAPKGEYVLIVFRARCEGLPNAVEQVNPMLDKDGKWRVAGYGRLAAVPDDFDDEFDLVVRAGRGQLSKDEKDKLLAQNHPLMSQLRDPPTKKLIEFFAKLPDAVHKELLSEGYLKWKLASLDAARQKVFKDTLQLQLDMAKKQGVKVPATMSMEALEKADVGVAVVNIPEQKQSVVSVYTLLTEHPQPIWVTVVGAKAAGKEPYFAAHRQQLSAVRAKPYSKTLPRDPDAKERQSKIDAAEKAAQAWLKLKDQEKFAQCWEQSSAFSKKSVSKEDVVKLQRDLLKKMGKLESRTIVSRQFATSLPGGPDGEYVVLQYQAKYSIAKDIIETVIPMLEKDGQWRVAGYHFAPGKGAQAEETTIKKFSPADKTISGNLAKDQGGWRIDAKKGETRTVHLFEVPDPGVENCLVYFRLKMKTRLQGEAYQVMWCRLPGKGEFFSKGLDQKVFGNTLWTTCQIPFRLEKGQRPDRIKLDLVVSGPGQVWVKDVEVVRAPLGP